MSEFPTIRILKHNPDRWSRVDLLQVGWGRVQVEDRDGGHLWIYSDDIHPDDRQAIAWGTITAPGDPQFTNPTRSFEEFTLTLTRAELTSLNRGLNCWLAEIRATKAKAQGEIPEVDQSLQIAASVCRRVDELLGIV